jgi:hypothetical protein
LLQTSLLSLDAKKFDKYFRVPNKNTMLVLAGFCEDKVRQFEAYNSSFDIFGQLRAVQAFVLLVRSVKCKRSMMIACLHCETEEGK